MSHPRPPHATARTDRPPSPMGQLSIFPVPGADLLLPRRDFTTLDPLTVTLTSIRVLLILRKRCDPFRVSFLGICALFSCQICLRTRATAAA